jgi:hypothetical protein
MFKKILLISAIAVAAVALTACAKTTTNKNTNAVSAVDIVTGVADIKIKETADKNLAIAKAKELWGVKFQMEEDLSSGPCLSNDLIPDWVADIAHNPRTAADDKPENQCPAYRNGTAHHFVELDPLGNLIRAE